MAWTDLSPYALAQVLHASDMNEIRLNLAETAPAIATAAGQVFYADGANSLDVLGISNNSVLRAGASAPRWDSLLRTAVSDLTDNSQDDDVPTFGALRETFLPVAGLYTRFTSAGQELETGTPIVISLPSGKAVDDFRWIQFIVSDFNSNVDGTIWLPESIIPSSAATPTLYAASSSQLYTVDTSSGALTAVGSGFGFNGIQGMTSQNGILYGTTNLAFVTINAVSGIGAVASAYGQGLGNVSGIASVNGVLYGIDAVDRKIFTINPANGVPTMLSGSAGLDSAGGMMDYLGHLYVVAAGPIRLLLVDVSDGTSVLQGTITGPVTTGASAIVSHAGLIYIANHIQDKLYTWTFGDYAVPPMELGDATDIRGLASHGGVVGIGVNGYLNVYTSSNSQLRINPLKAGYLHEVAGVL